MADVIRGLGAVAAGLAALNVFLLGLSGDAVSQEFIIAIGALNALVGAGVAFLAKPAPPP